MVLGVGVWSGSPSMIEIAGAFGFDFVWFCTEHTEYGSTETLSHLCRAADAAGVAPFVRVRDNDPILIRQALEAEWGFTHEGPFKGFKLHAIVNQLGLPLKATVTPGNSHDSPILPSLLEDLEADRIPAHIHVEAEITKGKYHDYDTFIGAEAVEYLKAYLELRRGGFDKLRPEKSAR